MDFQESERNLPGISGFHLGGSRTSELPGERGRFGSSSFEESGSGSCTVPEKWEVLILYALPEELKWIVHTSEE